MLPLLLPMFCFIFLALGAVVFVISGADKRMRVYALSAALWCAVWGPCLVVWMLFAGIIGIVGHFGLQHINLRELHLEAWTKGLGIGLLGLALVSTAVVATLVAWLHQAIVRRMTFALFRVYASVVVAGIGSVWGWSLGFWLVAEDVPHRLSLWIPAMVFLVGGFAYVGWHWAKLLRGEAPVRFAWVSRQEFDGAVEK